MLVSSYIGTFNNSINLNFCHLLRDKKMYFHTFLLDNVDPSLTLLDGAGEFCNKQNTDN